MGSSELWLALRDGRRRGVELALEGAELVSLVGVLVSREEESVSASWFALMALSRTDVLKVVTDLRRRCFWTRPLAVEGAAD